MLLVVPICHHDYDAMMALADWWQELHCQYDRHEALVVASSTLPKDKVEAAQQRIKQCGFRAVMGIHAHTEDSRGWPYGPNAMFRMTADYLSTRGKPWFWNEADCVPTREGWLDLLEVEYHRMGKPFMGSVYPYPFPHINGCAVYPANLRRYNPDVFNHNWQHLPFDLIKPDVTMKLAHVSPLIVRSLRDPSKYRGEQEWSFETMAELKAVVPDSCVLFHGCRDGSIIQRLKEASNGAAHYEEPTVMRNFISRAKALICGPNTYVHAGNIGDMIYGLYAIKAAGGGQLIICPEQRNLAPCAVPIDRQQFDMLVPLLRAQTYLTDVSFSQGYPSGRFRDLNRFRDVWFNPKVRAKHGIDTLCKAHFYELGILHRYHGDTAWIKVPDPIKTGKIVVHRSPRYNSPPHGPQSFPWQRLIDQHRPDMLFIGLPAEHQKFQRDFAAKVEFRKVKDFLEMARLIAGARCFIGNQSAPLSMAIGCGQRVICEALPRSPDCRFERKNYTDQLIGEIGAI